MTRTFTLDELDALARCAEAGPVDPHADPDKWSTADETLYRAAPTLVAFARALLTECEAVARLHRQQVERLEDDAATLAAERDALRATVGRVRPVVEALADTMDRCVVDPENIEFSARRAASRIAHTLSNRLTGVTWQDNARSLRALLADAPADIGEVLERGADADGAALDALGIVPAGVSDV